MSPRSEPAGWGNSPWGSTPWGSVAGWGDGEWGDFPWGGTEGIAAYTPLTNYRLSLAERSDTGLGASIIDDVLALGFPTDNEMVGRWSRTLNAAGTFEFSLPIDACTPDVFAPGQRELHLFRDDGAGEFIAWAGHLWIADVRAPWVRFMGMGFYEALRHREMSEDFYKFSAEQRNIAWELIAYTQAQTGGGLGITRESSAGSAVQRTLAICAEERQNIAEAIEDLAAADDGFDFEVGPDKVWRTWAPQRGTDLSDTVGLDGRTTITDLAYTIDATAVENDIAGIGEKGDCEPITFERAIDTDSRTLFGLMQGTISRSDIKQDDDLIAALTAQRLVLQRTPRKQPTVRMFQGLSGGPSPLTADFDLGDVISVSASWGYATFADRFRVMGYSVAFDRLGYETIDLTLDSVVSAGGSVSPPPGTTGFDSGFDERAFA